MEEHPRLIRQAFEIAADARAGVQEIQKLAMGRTNVVFKEVSGRK